MRCVCGFLTAGSYEEIPLEKQAYELAGSFANDPIKCFRSRTMYWSEFG